MTTTPSHEPGPLSAADADPDDALSAGEAAAESSGLRMRQFRVPTLARHLGIAVIAAIALAIATALVGDYRDYQLAEIAAYVTAVAGLTVLIGLSGQISIGHGAFMAVGGYVAALLFLHLQWPLVLILLVATAAAAVTGAIFGIAAGRLRGPYLAGATLMLAVALPTLSTQFQSVLGGDQGLGFFVTVPGFLGVNFRCRAGRRGSTARSR